VGILSYIAAIFTLVAGLSAPLSAAAVGFSFGGRLVSPPVLCANIPGSYLVTILPAGVKGIFYIYTPGLTLGLPPVHPGQEILGIADVPLVCNGLLGLRIQYDGVSI
jgi:hypothetical protein